MRLPGRLVAPGVRHVLKFRFPYQAFSGQLGNGVGASKAIAPGARGLVIGAPPSAAETADLDLYVSDGAPYEPPGAAARGAVIGPLRNAAGQALTGISRRFPALRLPSPPGIRTHDPKDGEPAIRGLWVGRGGYGFAWVVEVAVSLQWFTQRPAFTREPDTPQPWSACALPPPWGWGDFLPAPSDAHWLPTRRSRSAAY